MQLDVKRARSAIACVSAPMKLSAEEAALAIIKVAEESMTNALKLITLQRGHDPRDLALIASGGAGPLLAVSLGKELKVKRTVIPTHLGFFSAWGMPAARPRADLRRTVLKAVCEEEMSSISQLSAELEQESKEYFTGSSARKLKFHHRAELRYRGQEHRVSVGFSGGSAEKLLSDFHATHQKTVPFALKATAEITMPHLQAEMFSEVIGLLRIQGNEENTPDSAQGPTLRFPDKGEGLGRLQRLLSKPASDRIVDSGPSAHRGADNHDIGAV